MWSILNYLRTDPEKLRWNLRVRGMDETLVDKAIDFDKRWRATLTKVNELRHKHNVVSREIAKLSGEEKREKIEEARKLRAEIEALEAELQRLETEREKALLAMPNVLLSDVPTGADETENVPIRFWGKPKVPKQFLERFKEQVKGHDVEYEVIDYVLTHHADALTALGVGDTEKAARVAGSRFFYLFDDLVWLDIALVLYALDHMTSKGFRPVIPPYMLRRKVYEGVTAIEDFETALYKVEGEDLYLIATSEHPIATLHMGEIIFEKDLPLLYTGVSPCFRKEAGAHGKDTKGVFRVHQFHKVEQFVFCLPEDSPEWHEVLIKNAEELWQGLGLPYRVVNVCTGDIGVVAAKKYDLEVWFPAQGRYREVVSCSNCTDWQSYRLKIRFQRKSGERGFVHTLNSTAIATTRAITAILENCQRPDGTVEIPKVLRRYLELFPEAPKECIEPRKPPTKTRIG